MPIYSFKCKQCGYVDDHILKSSEINTSVEKDILCSVCGDDTVRLVSATSSFVFNGVSFSSSSNPTKS